MMQMKPDIMNEVLVYKTAKGEVVDLKAKGFDLLMHDAHSFLFWLGDEATQSTINSVFDEQLKKVWLSMQIGERRAAVETAKHIDARRTARITRRERKVTADVANHAKLESYRDRHLRNYVESELQHLRQKPQMESDRIQFVSKLWEGLKDQLTRERAVWARARRLADAAVREVEFAAPAAELIRAGAMGGGHHPEVCELAARLAEARGDQYNLLNSIAWGIVRFAGRPRRDVEAALRRAEVCCRACPERGTFINTLGVAQYRLGLYDEALVTLERSNVFSARESGYEHPMDTLFLAMACWHLGRRDEAMSWYARGAAVAKAEILRRRGGA